MGNDDKTLIAIASYDMKNITGCYSVKSSPILAPGKGPKYVLNGIDRISIFGEHTVLLGLYMEAEDVEKEIKEILSAIENGVRTYTLKYCSDIEWGGVLGTPKDNN